MRESQIEAMMSKLADRQITREEVAQVLNCSVRTVNRIMERRGVVRKEGNRRVADRERQARKAAKIKAGEAVLKGRWRLETAADKVGLTVRSMEKWVEKAQKRTKKARKL